MPQTEQKGDGASSSGDDLSALLKLLTNKLVKEDEEKSKTNITAENFGKVVADYDGESIPVEHWLETFDINAEAYGLNEKQKYVQARNKMTGTANLFLETVSLCDYVNLKAVLIKEFAKTYSSAELHKKLSSRKKLDTESFHEYILKMRKIAALGHIEEISVIQYVWTGCA